MLVHFSETLVNKLFFADDHVSLRLDLFSVNLVGPFKFGEHSTAVL